MQRIVIICLFLGVSWACVKSVETEKLSFVGAVDAGVKEKTPYEKRVDVFESLVGTYFREKESLVWNVWRDGGTFVHPPVTDALKVEEVYFRQLPFPKDASGTRARYLTQFVQGQLVAEKTKPLLIELNDLEEALTYTVDGLEFAWRDTYKVLAHEKSAMKRKALWAAAAIPTKQIVEVLTRLNAATEESLAQFEIPSELQFASEVREFDADELAAFAVAYLDTTDAEWNDVLARLSQVEMKLPNGALTRADIPRLFRVPKSVDDSFPKEKLVERLQPLLKDKKVNLVLADVKTNPLPLLSFADSSETKISLFPTGGLLEMQRSLQLVGEAVAFVQVDHLSGVLKESSTVVSKGSQNQRLLETTAYLTQIGIPEAAHEQIQFHAKAHRLLVERRTCHQFLAKFHGHSLSLPGVLNLKSLPADDVRFGFDVHDSWRSATVLKAMKMTASPAAPTPETLKSDAGVATKNAAPEMETASFKTDSGI
jgi:hypothetical protein